MLCVPLKKVCLLMVLVCSCRAITTDTSVLRFDPTNLSVVEGNNATLTCNISNNEPGAYFIDQNNQSSNVYTPCNVTGPLTNTQKYSVRCNHEDVEITILHVTRVRDGEVWICRRIMFGKLYESSSTIFVKYPPKLLEFRYQKATTNEQTIMVDKSLNVVRNDSFTLTCTTDSQPPSTYQWTWTGNHNFRDTHTENLAVISIQEDLSLTCNATNIMTETFEAPSSHSVTSTININVQYPPSTPVVSIQKTPNGASSLYNITTVTIIQGDSVKMTCTADSNPQPHSYHWTRPSYGIYFRNSTLVLLNVAVQHKGDYSCTAENNMNRTFGDDPVGNNSRRVEIDILYPTKKPELYFNTRNQSIHNNLLRVIKGTTFNVGCLSIGNPVPNKYSWNYSTMNDKHIAVIKNILKDISLTCTVTNIMIDSFEERRDGTANATLAVKVLYPPQDIELKVNNEHVLWRNNTAYVIEGDKVTLSCNADSEPSPSMFTWSKLPSTELLTSATGEYSIDRINKNQHGQYKCLVENVMNPSFENQQHRNNSRYLRLEVLYPSNINTFKVDGYTTVNVTLSEKDNFTLVCNVEGKPESNVSILHEDTPLKNATVMKNVNYTVTNVTCVQQGQYACTTKNMYNTERTMQYLTLFVRCSPRPKPNSELQDVFASALNVDTTISFEVLAFPVPSEAGFKWEKEIKNGSSWNELENNDNILVSSYVVQYNLTLKNVSRSSFGNYRLNVTNNVGTYIHQFVLTAEDIPQSPTNFQEVEELVTDSTLAFKWSPGFNGGLPQTFLLHYRKTNSMDHWLVQRISDNGSPIINATLESLTSSTMYDVYLIASNVRGNSSAVQIAAVQTGAIEGPDDGNRIMQAVSGVTASVVVICIIVVIVVLYKRRQNQKDPEGCQSATTPNVSRGVYEIGPCESVFFHRNDDANKAGTDGKSKIYQNVPDLQLSSSATISKQSSSKAQPATAPVSSKTIYENLHGFSEKRKATNKLKIKPKVVERSSPQNLLEPDDDEVHCERQNNDVYGNIGRRIERVQVAELLTYVTSKSYEPEYLGFLKGIQFPTTVAMKPENIKLNRYQGIYPYDHSRVTIPDDQTFFMNACYINGYSREKAYIASLGPTSDTTNGYRTFWKMIWHGQTDIILMVTNLREITGMKCQQYWPKLGTSITYGDVTATCQAETVYAEYTVRVFSVSKSGVFRTLHQLHFTAWPDKGVPDDVTSLLEFRNRIKATSTMGIGPIIVHCSAGIGRTGTLIALDILIDEGKAAGSVNVSACVKRLREQRVNMVQTAEQYAFVHKALVYILAFECETIHSENFQEYLESSTDMFFENMLKQLQPNVARDADVEAKRRNEKYTKINRPNADIPGDKHSVKLYLNKDSDDVDYINAVYINSFKKKNHFISAQTPRMSSEEDFLNLIFQEGCMCIVTFDQSEAHGNERVSKDIGVYLPPENQNLTIGNFKVSCSRLETKPQYIVRRMKVENHGKFDSGEKISYHFQYTRWESDKRMPDDPSEFAQFIKDIDQYVNELGETDVHVLVHCMDASERSGLFCSIATMIEKIECEGRVNVGNTIRQIRNRRMTAIQNMEQLRFCHQAVNAYNNMKSPQ